MARQATNQGTTIGIDIGKNSFHLNGLDGRLGSFFPVRWLCPPRPDLGEFRTEAARFPTSVLEGPQ